MFWESLFGHRRRRPDMAAVWIRCGGAQLPYPPVQGHLSGAGKCFTSDIGCFAICWWIIGRIRRCVIDLLWSNRRSECLRCDGIEIFLIFLHSTTRFWRIHYCIFCLKLLRSDQMILRWSSKGIIEETVVDRARKYRNWWGGMRDILVVRLFKEPFFCGLVFAPLIRNKLI